MRSLVTAIALLAVWALVTSTGLVPPYILPTPFSIVASFRLSMIEGALATLARAVVGFVAGVGIAYVSILIAHCARLTRSADAQFSAARAIPALAAMPLFLLWFGLGEIPRILVVTLSVLAYVAGPLAESTRALPREWLIQRERLGRSRNWEYWNIVVPGTLGPMIGGLRVGLAIALTMAVATDFMGVSTGLGRSVDTARVTFNIPAIFLLLIMAAVMGLTLDRLLSEGLRRTAHWLGRTAKG